VVLPHDRLKVRHLAERAVTVPEVFKELKDSAGRANATDLTLMPLDGLQVMEPSEESLRAGPCETLSPPTPYSHLLTPHPPIIRLTSTPHTRLRTSGVSTVPER
jgi:hypothetical protein